jgi:hypothetical protein
MGKSCQHVRFAFTQLMLSLDHGCHKLPLHAVYGGTPKLIVRESPWGRLMHPERRAFQRIWQSVLYCGAFGFLFGLAFA